MEAKKPFSGPAKEQYNNLDIHRVLRHFPAWSSAYNLYYQNTGKLLGPLMQAISTKTNLVDAIVESTYNSRIPFEYSRFSYTYRSVQIPDQLETTSGMYRYVGDIGDCNPAMYSYKSAELIPYGKFFKWEYSGMNMQTQVLLNEPCRIYLQSPGANQHAVKTIHIIGADKYGSKLMESIQCNSEALRETINEYSYILRVHSENEFWVGTSVNLNAYNGSHSLQQIAGFSKRICDMYGNFFDPEFYSDGRNIFCFNSTSGTREDNWRMHLDIPEGELIQQFFVTTYFDIIALTDAGSVYTGKLMLDNYAEGMQFEQTNNNDVIQMDYDQNGEISASINVDALKDFFGATYVRLELLNRGKYVYIDGKGEVRNDSDTWIDISQMQGKTRVYFNRDNEDFYEITIRTNSSPEVFCVRTIMNKVNMYKVLTDCSEMFFFNRRLGFVKDGQNHTFSGKRHVFLQTSGNILFSEPVVFGSKQDPQPDPSPEPDIPEEFTIKDLVDGWYDFRHMANLFQDEQGTIPVDSSNDDVKRVKDLSGNGKDLIISDSSGKPGAKYRTALKQDGQPDSIGYLEITKDNPLHAAIQTTQNIICVLPNNIGLQTIISDAPTVNIYPKGSGKFRLGIVIVPKAGLNADDMKEIEDYIKAEKQTWNSTATLQLENYFAAEPYVTDVTGWDVQRITNMDYMFNGITNFNQNIQKWNTSKVKSFQSTFNMCTSFNQDVGDWNTSSATNMTGMFSGCKIFNKSINAWNVSNVTLAPNMFAKCSQFNQPLASWNTSKITNMQSMFNSATAFNQNLNSWNTAACKDMSAMFSSASVYNQPMNLWSVGNVTNMVNMFLKATMFNQPIGNWDVSKVTGNKKPVDITDTGGWALGLAGMFNGATSFNQYIGDWNVSNCDIFSDMFSEATSFTQPLTNWRLTKAIDCTAMFYKSNWNHPVAQWSPQILTRTARMFAQAYKFNQNMNTWNVSTLKYTQQMFEGNPVYNQPMHLWDTSSLRWCQSMFNQAFAFNQSLNTWDMQKVVRADYMFSNAKVYNSPMGLWKVQSLDGVGLAGLLSGAQNYSQDLSTWCVQHIPVEPVNFQVSTQIQPIKSPKWGVPC